MMQLEMLSIDLSNYCSKQCSFCYNHSTREGNVMWEAGEVISFAQDCVANGIKAISLGGGEPFEYDGVFDIIDALQPIAYLSVTSNGLPLQNDETWQMLLRHKPDKIHITIHHPDNDTEVDRVIETVSRLSETSIKPGVNLLVSASRIENARNVYERLRKTMNADQIILVPQRFSDSPTPRQLAYVTGGQPFQSPDCILSCKRPTKFCSVSWDKRVNSCSFAGGKERLETLDFAGLTSALSKVVFESCCKR